MQSTCLCKATGMAPVTADLVFYRVVVEKCVIMFPWIDDDLNDRRQRGQYRVRRHLQSAQGADIRLRGRDLLNFASNDYLNLAADPRLAQAAARAARRYGCGAGAAPLVSGYLPPLRALERDLAHWEESEAALVFSSGYVTNLAVIGSLCGMGVGGASRPSPLGPAHAMVFSDELNHASLIDGCRLAKAPVHVYRHADAGHLEDMLQETGKEARRRLIVTDTVFSMDGDLAPLADLIDLAERHDCLLLIDEAHATGVLGDHGRGLAELLLSGRSRWPGGSERVIKVGTLSKALGSQGGFVCGSRQLIDWLINFARPYIFSTALAPPCAAAARQAVSIVTTEPERRQHLLALANFLRDELCRIGYPVHGSRCQIVPVIIGEAQAAMELSARLEEQGLLVPAIRQPAVPEGTARLRISLTAGHTEQDVERLIDGLRRSRMPAS